MSNIAVVYHSGYGHTLKVAEAIYETLQSISKIHADLLAIDAEGNLSEAGWHTLSQADTIIFGSATYMGSVSWQFKKFADASSKVWGAQGWKDKFAAGFTNSASMNGDKLSTLHYMVTLAMQQSMLWISMGIMPSNTKAADRNDLNYLGAYVGLMAQSPSDASPEEGPLAGDLETASIFARRIANLTLQYKPSS